MAATARSKPHEAESTKMDIPISENLKHAHRTAKVIELMGASTKSFEDAIRHALEDASATTRGITGAHVQNMSVRCENGKITEYKVDLKVAFGIERTAQP